MLQVLCVKNSFYFLQISMILNPLIPLFWLVILSPLYHLSRSPQRRRPEPRCLFSPVKPSPSPAKQKVAGGLAAEQPALSSENKRQAQDEALR